MMRRLRPRRDDDRGISLVEILVAMALLSTVMALGTTALVRAIDTNQTLVQQTDAQNRNNSGMEIMTRLLRQATLPKNGTSSTSSIITVATSTKLQFTSRMSSTAGASPTSFPDPVQYLFQLSGTDLMWGTGAQNTCTGTTLCTYATPTLTKTAVYGVQNASGTSVCPQNTGDGAVFHYWYVDATGNLAAWSSTSNTLSQISVVQIDLWTQTQSGPSKTRPKCVPLSDYVQLRNWS